jgi:glycosyltransferase involved in cell wall biosynthesis
MENSILGKRIGKKVEIIQAYIKSFFWIIVYGLPLKKKNKRCIMVTMDLFVGGAPLVLLDVAENFIKRGYEGLLITRKMGSLYTNFNQQGVKILFCRRRNVIRKKIIQGIQTDLIFINTIPIYFWINGWKSNTARRIWWLHEGVTYMEKIAKPLRELDVENVDIYCVSSRVKMALQQTGLKWKTEYFYYNVSDIQNAEMVLKKENAGNKIKVICIGAIYSLKNQIEFIEACAQLDETVRNRCKVLLIGRPVKQEYYRLVQEELKKNDWIDYVEYIKHEEMGEIYKEKCIIVSTSKDDSLPVVLAEGMMYGNIVITSSETGFYGLVKNGENGYSYQLGDVDTLASLLNTAVLHYDELSDVRKNARNTYMELFNKAAFEKRLDEIVEKRV